jgi:hypothetical protein
VSVSVSVPLLLVVVGLATAYGVQEVMGPFASAELDRLASHARLWAAFRTLALIAQSVLHAWGKYAPSRLAALSFVHASSLIWASYVQADAMRPPEGVHVPRGPLRRLCEAACARLSSCQAARRAAPEPSASGQEASEVL